MLAVLLLLAYVSLIAGACPDCDELLDSGPTGACCLGSVSIGNDYTEARCNHVWAGPGTTSEDCEELRPCCYEYQNGLCTRERCFDCFHNNGTNVHSCSSCIDRGTTTEPTTRTRHTHSRTSFTLPTLTTPSPTGGTGCCCIPNRLPRQVTAEECHDCGGQYRGDGTSCSTPDVCLAQCCHTATRTCDACPQGYNSSYTFVTFGESCPAEACGVTCCLNAQAIEADSSQICTDAGGEAFPETPLEEAECGGLCCVGLQYSIVANEEECLENSGGRYIGDGVGYEPGACGGACCGEGCGILTLEACADVGGVYQGDDVECGDFQVHGPNEDSTSSDTPSSRSRSSRWSSSTDDSETTSETTADTEGSSEEDDEYLDVCYNDGVCCLPNAGGPVRVANSRACKKRGGVFLGENTWIGDDSDDGSQYGQCEGGVCCCESDGFGGKLVGSKAECDLFEGVYRGDGSRLDQPGVCDSHAGACICGEDCIDVPSAQKCLELHGKSFRGVGTRCTDDDIFPPEESDDEGACCVAQSFHNDRPRCELQPSRKHCQYVGGIWSGSGTECRDDTCVDLRGACCTTGENHEPICRDDVSVQECRKCHGHWSGAESRCSDEYTCQPTSLGACCREGHDCSMTTVTACRRVGGNFQGTESTCQSNHGQICKRCAPCEHDAPSCDDQTPCENPNAVCVHKYGKCMVIATAIPTEYNYTAPPEETDDDSDSSASPSDEVPTTTTIATTTTPSPTPDGVRKRAPPHHHGHHGHGHGHHSDSDEDSDPVAAVPPNYLGPLRCSEDNSTIGLPCVVSEFRGKCRIGTCMAPPVNSSLTGGSCGAICRNIHEYACGCECDGAWMRKCGAISGRVINDTNHNGDFDSGDGGVVHARVKLYKSDGDGGYDFVSEQYSGPSGGHYAFSSLEPGVYKVRVTLPGCQAFESDTNHRFVTVSCMESAEAALRTDHRYNKKPAPHSYLLEHRENGEHLANGIDFFTVYDCEEADEQRDDIDSDGDLGDAPTPEPTDDDSSSGDSGLSTGAIIGIAIGAVAACILLILLVVFIANRRGALLSGSMHSGNRMRSGKKSSSRR